LIWDLGKKLNFKYDKTVYLNYLKVDIYKNVNNGFEDIEDYNDIIENVNRTSFNSQIESNLLSLNISNSSFTEHAKYALKNNMDAVYYTIRDFIKNENNARYNRKNILEEYIDKTNDIGLLKELVVLQNYNENQNDLSWESILILIKKGENDFVIQVLLKFLEVTENSRDKLAAIKYLVRANYEFAFQIFNAWLIVNISNYNQELNYGLNSQDWQLHSNAKSIPYLIELIKISNNSVYDFKNRYKPSRIVHDTIRSICQNNPAEICLEILDKLEICLGQLENDDDDIFYVNTMINDTKDIYYKHKSKPMEFSEIASKIESYKYEML